MHSGLDRLPWYGQITAFVVVAAAGLVVAQQSLVIPRREAVAVRRQELVEGRLDLDAARQTASHRFELEAELHALELRLDRGRAVLGEAQDRSQLLRQLQTLAVQTSLSIRSFTPHAVLPQELHAEWPIHLELRGTYHNLGVFFDRVNKVSQVITISDLVIHAVAPPARNATIAVECTVTTYVLNDADGGVHGQPSGRSFASHPEVERYAYDPEHRRDPFVSLLRRDSALSSIRERPGGLPGLRVSEVLLVGIVVRKEHSLAIIQARDATAYILRGEERLLDGAVKTITAEGVVFLQDAVDSDSPLEILRTLREPEARP